MDRHRKVTASWKRIAPTGIALALCLAAPAAGAEGSMQDLAAIESMAQAFAVVHLGRGASDEISASRVDARLRLPACAKLEAFLPDGRMREGRLTVGVRCAQPVSWRVYVPIEVKSPVTAKRLSEATTLPGSTAAPVDSVRTVSIDPDLGNGTAAAPGVLAHPVAADPRRPPPRAEPVISAGQSVRVEVRGPGFAVRAEGKALASAAAGQPIRVRMGSGQVVSGVVRLPGYVEVAI